MTCSVPLRCLVLGLGLMLAGGCSMSRGSLASHKADSDRRAVEDLAEDDAPVKTASLEADASDNGDAPPSQPGVKSSGGSRKKLVGWLQKDGPKSGSIPLDRTDKSKAQNEESLAEEDAGFWKHKDDSDTAPLTASKSAGSKSSQREEDSSELSLGDSSSPFDP